MKAPQPAKQLMCEHCGHKGDDILQALYWVGGKGYVLGTYCLDREKCWARWNKQNGYLNHIGNLPGVYGK